MESWAERRDDILFVIDPEPLENKLKQAEANLSRDMIQQENAKEEAIRQDKLFKKGLTSEDLYYQAKTSFDALGATVKSDEAAVKDAKIQLGYCTILSPIDGKTGKKLVDPGNLVEANKTTLNTINQIKPINAGFTVPEQLLGEIRKQMAAGKLEVRVFLPDEPGTQETGVLTFIDNTIDRSTGAINLKATFPNNSSRLWPGQFVQLFVVLSLQANAIVVPSEAVLTGQSGTYVFVVKPDMSAENRAVKVTRQLDNSAIIAEGLQPGELVVIEGQQLIGGLNSKVDIRNTPTNTPAANP